MKAYFALFSLATLASLITTPIIRRLCQRFELLDVPTDGRRLHRQAIPRLGGVALYLSCVFALVTLPIFDRELAQSLFGGRSELFAVFVSSTLVLCLGIYDDLKGTNAVVKFVGLGLIASLFYALGGRVDALSVPFVGSLQLPAIVSYLITVLWLVGIANAFNLIDGMDGLASGAALFSSLVILVVSISQGRPLMIVVALVLSGALAGFLRYNFNPASIFLGDSGALFIGFLLAALSVLGVQKATTAVAIVVPILAFGFPMVDTAMTMGRRLISGRPIFEGDAEHIHHMLLARGWSQRRAALVLYGVCAAFGLTAMVFPVTGSKLTGFMLFVISVAVIIAVGHLRYHEVDELTAGVKRNVVDRRLKVANNIRVRRAARSLSKASDLHEMFEALRHMLEFNEFNFATAQVGQPGRAELNERAFKASLSRHPKQALELKNGRVYWSWSSDGGDVETLIRSRSAWSFQLPLVKDGVEWGWLNFYRSFASEGLLVDTNYLSDLFRQEFTNATARLISLHEASVSLAEMAVDITPEKIPG
jgi:UDP-GlcNAc:undecaprenyl-phosphate GlcNAc-1-phosphate transferase